MEIERLIEIAQDVNLLSEAAQLCYIKQRLTDANCELILPLIGEFSAGKTTLINALTDSKKLETASKPTTATIYEIHFGEEKCFAEIYDESGNKKRIDDISSLINDELADALVVNVFDTSKRVPSGIILVDTPGLSSSDPRHKQTLIDFLPKADAVLLAVDVNQSVTKSLTDFIQTMSLAKRPVFLILTQCDTKSPSDVENQKKYIADNCHLPLGQVVCVSAKRNQLDDLYKLLDSIQAEKATILQQVNAHRIKSIISTMLEHIDNMLKVSGSDKELEEAIGGKEAELKQISCNIESLISSSRNDIEDIERNICRIFEDSVFERMDSIVAGKSENYDGEATSAINSLASIYINDFRNRIHRVLAEKANERQNSLEGIDLQSVLNLDLSSLSAGTLSYNLDLNSIGHEKDGIISVGVKVAAAAVVASAVVATAGAAAGAAAGTAGTAAGTAGAASTAGAAGAATTAVEVGTMVEAVDIATDVGSIISNQKHISRVQKAMQFAGKASEQYETIESMNQNAGQKVGQNKGIVEGLVGFVTDKTWGKPQRRRAIRMYIDDTLMPQFKLAMSDNSTSVVNSISNALHQEALVTIAEKKTALEMLRQQHKEQRETFKKRLETLRDYKNELLTV